MRLRPGFEVFWRERGASQLGLDPRCALRLEGLSDAEQRLVDEIPRVLDVATLRQRGNQLGVPRRRVAALLGRVQESNLLTDRPHGCDQDPDAAYWHRAAAGGLTRPADRAQAVVEVRGLDRLGLRLALIAAEAGAGTVLVRDETVVRAEDVSPGLYRPVDVGRCRERIAVSLIRAAVPSVRMSAPASVRPDLVVLVRPDVVDPVPVRALMREDVPHLCVVTGELAVTVGPLVRPGLSACTRCLDLYRCDEDERWPALATQAAARRPHGPETSLAWSGAALAAQMLLAAVDGRQVQAEGATLELTGWQAVPVERRWDPHPECGCTQTSLERSPQERGTREGVRTPAAPWVTMHR
ncbi:thiamine biosynthesis protein ThiF [Ruania suaedae]|uniref:thiamine biosynthesis protein ThiF n=1 Tax=Ruania suaedae TaxID=2897774 RepID=UPI001E527C0C|nr:thiamine biosynthesis protein ThiF [Ruania suaedae]UFU03955.1 thiamine biosynthesis protein ThiF [Ruania suaedae]